MEVILLEKIKNLGDLGDRVKVRPGYGRNYLIPQGKAVPATPENVRRFEERRVELERQAAEARAAAEARREKLEGLEVTIPARAGQEGKLFGSVGTRDIAEAVTAAAGIEVERREVLMPEGPIRQTGEYEIELQLHSDVSARVRIVVVPESG